MAASRAVDAPPYPERLCASQQNLIRPDYANVNVLNTSSSVHLSSPIDMKPNSELSPMRDRNQKGNLNTESQITDGRENSVKMLESRTNSSLLGVIRGPADGSSRQNSFCRQNESTNAEVSKTDKDCSISDERVRVLTTKCKELETACRFAEVKSERLTEHVKVLSRKVKFVENKLEQTEVLLRRERMKSAKLEKSLERAHIDIKNTPNHLKHVKVDQDYSNQWEHNVISSSSNQENTFSCTFEDCYNRKELKSAKDRIKYTPQKKRPDLEPSIKHLRDERQIFYTV